MKPAEYRGREHRDARQQLAGLRIVKPSVARQPLFQYGYLARLLDDRELNAIQDAEIRSATRAAHRQVYRKSLRLLSRDVSRMLENRRKLMDARQEWRFEDLVTETSRAWRLLWTLRVAGVAHGLHVPVMAAAAQEACAELHAWMSPRPLTSCPAVPAL